MCFDGRILGATKFGYDWAIPSGVENLDDSRITTGKYKKLAKNSPKKKNKWRGMHVKDYG